MFGYIALNAAALPEEAARRYRIHYCGLCRALKEKGLEVVLINPNPATIMTDHVMADKIYIEPLTPEVVKRIIRKEKPQGFLSACAGIRPDSHLFQNHSGMLGPYRIIINHKNIHRAGVDLTTPVFLPVFAVPERYRNRKLRSDTLLGLNTDGTVHHFHDPFRDGHPQTAAAVLRPVPGIFLGKGIKDFWQILFIHANTGIPDTEPDRRLAVEFCRFFNCQ